jgi:hypothetical protein
MRTRSIKIGRVEAEIWLTFPIVGRSRVCAFSICEESEKRKVGSKFVLVVVVVPNLRRNRVENPPAKCFSTSVYIDLLVESYGVSH